MKIVSDFDGVLTEQTHEAERVHEIFLDEMAGTNAATRSEIQAQISAVLSEMKEAPTLHGWKDQGRVSAFFDEDLFIRNVGLARFFDEKASEKGFFSDLLGALKKKNYSSFSDLCQFAFEEMARETSKGVRKPFQEDSVQFIEKALSRGHEIVVVSNSTTKRIIEMFKSAGLNATDHHEGKKERLRVRGDASKFTLGEEKRGFKLGHRYFETHRPRYEAILMEENPSVVIGDVFSLDLALPYWLSTENHLSNLRLYLRLRAYTPEWSRLEAPALSNSKAKVIPIQNLSEIEI